MAADATRNEWGEKRHDSGLEMGLGITEFQHHRTRIIALAPTDS